MLNRVIEKNMVSLTHGFSSEFLIHGGDKLIRLRHGCDKAPPRLLLSSIFHVRVLSLTVR